MAKEERLEKGRPPDLYSVDLLAEDRSCWHFLSFFFFFLLCGRLSGNIQAMPSMKSQAVQLNGNYYLDYFGIRMYVCRVT